LDILKYRRIGTDEEKKKAYPGLHRFHQSSCLKNFVFLLSLGFIVFGLLIGHSAIAKPYSWTMLENACYYTITHLMYASGNIALLFVIFCGGGTMSKAFLSRPFFVALGKLCFISSLITPICVQLIYSQLPNGLFITFNGVFELGVGNVVCVMAAGIALYIMFELPFRRLI
jgi:hypothetical protein